MILDGKKLRLEKIKELVLKLEELDKKPTLVAVGVGTSPAFDSYIKSVKKVTEELNLPFIDKRLPGDITTEEVITVIKELNLNEDVNGILLEHPLPKILDETQIIDSLDPNKDVDGLTEVNAGRLFQGKEAFCPCTPKGVLTLLKEYQIPLEGKRVAVVGRSISVGKPVFALLLNENATVTVCHSKTKDLKEILSESDIVVAAIGRAEAIKADMIKEGAVVIDVGINRNEHGKLVGDVDFKEIEKKASYITPVPGGVGPLTVLSLIENTLLAQERQEKHRKKLVK